MLRSAEDVATLLAWAVQQQEAGAATVAVGKTTRIFDGDEAVTCSIETAEGRRFVVDVGERWSALP